MILYSLSLFANRCKKEPKKSLTARTRSVSFVGYTQIRQLADSRNGIPSFSLRRAMNIIVTNWPSYIAFEWVTGDFCDAFSQDITVKQGTITNSL
jgi:hypothetical protein